jgi:drug/metabolite transporter (DMT)-like permease
MSGVLVGFLGMGILIGPAALPQSGISAPGALAMLATAVSYAVGNVYARTANNPDPARLALGQQIFSALPATILAVVLIGPHGFDPVPERAPRTRILQRAHQSNALSVRHPESRPPARCSA